MTSGIDISNTFLQKKIIASIISGKMAVVKTGKTVTGIKSGSGQPSIKINEIM